MPKVLVIGGGFAGMKLAISLVAKGHEVTLVNKTDYFEAAFANARSVVEPSIMDQTLIPYDAIKPHGTFILGEVIRLTDTSATLADGQTVDFDYAAICSGSDYAVGKSSTALTVDKRRQELKALAERVKAAGSVLIAGGGPLGVELAGEILTDYPDKVVTLVHSGARLLPTLPEKLGRAAAEWLLNKGCKIMLNDKLDTQAATTGGSFQGCTGKGVAVSCDVLLVATGIKYNSAFMKQDLADAVDEYGRIKVDQHLRVVGHPKLFAVGDVTDVKEEKLAFLAAKQGELVAASLHALLKAPANAAAPRLGIWKPSMGVPVMMVTLGRNYGVGRIACLTFTGWLPTKMKSRNILGFVAKYRQELMRQ
eukprot:gene2211-2526_t